MTSQPVLWLLLVAAIFVPFVPDSIAHADHIQFTSSFLYDANSWPGSATDAGVFGQGFTPRLNVIPDPGHLELDLVGLDRFTFFKDGYTDAAAEIKLAIFDNFYLDLAGLAASRPEFVGMSTNVIASTAGMPTGAPYTFEFANLQLEYGADYGAIFVNDDGAGNLTPIKVSALTADYVETSPGSGVYLPESNFGGEFDFQYATSNFINSNQFGDFLFGFSEGGDAKFEAVYDLDDPRDDTFEFSSSFLNDANSWPGSALDPGIYGQGFRPALEASQLGHLATDTVGLDKFSFFKDGYLDGQSDIKLVIIENMFLDLDGLTITSEGVVGVSTNTIAGTDGLDVGEEYSFEFSNLQLNYIDDYAAVFVNDDGAGNLTPIKVSALTADYEETSPGSGVYVPASNYGEEDDFEWSTSSALDMPGSGGTFLIAYEAGGDAKFSALFDMARPGDFDDDGDVDGDDFLVWQASFGQAVNPGTEGDANGDGVVDGDDFLIWQSDFGGPASAPVGAAAVPEPSSIACVMLVGFALLLMRRRKEHPCAYMFRERLRSR